MRSSGNTRSVGTDFETKLGNEYEFQTMELDSEEIVAYRLTHRRTRQQEYLHLLTTGDANDRITHTLRSPNLIQDEPALRQALKLSDSTM
jgi:superfamily I DNA and RNA helicase